MFDCQEPQFDQRLPMPWVHWPPIGSGIFVAFSLSPDSPTFLCECARPVVSNWREFVDIWTHRRGTGHWAEELNYRGTGDPCSEPFSAPWELFASNIPTETDVTNFFRDRAFPKCCDSETSLDNVGFASNICHRCTGHMPLDNHDGGSERTPQSTFWLEPLREYFEQEWLRRKIYPSSDLNGGTSGSWDYLSHIEEDFLKQLVDGLKDPSADDDVGTRGRPMRRSNDIRRQLNDITRNAVRECFPRGGRPGQREANLASLVKVLFSEQVCLRNDRPPWLGGLELDIHLPELQLAFEHNGQQHYGPVDHFGGQQAFEAQVERDRRKESLCARKGVTLVVVSYKDALTQGRIHELAAAAGYQP